MTGAERELGPRELNRALLHRQLLLERSSLTIQEAVAHLVGLQAQAVRPPYLALWTRLADFTIEALEQLIVDGVVVRTALMRSTLHLVTAPDCLALRPLLSGSLARIVKGQFGRKVAGVDLDELANLATTLVEQRPLTFAELGQQLAATWPGRDANALAQTARNLVPLVQVPPRGLWDSSAPARHTTVATWLGRPMLNAPLIDEYVLRYLAAYGPASVADMQKWSGTTHLDAAFRRLGPRLRRYRDDHGRALFDLADRELPDPANHVPVRYLPEFDSVLLAHAKRDRIMSDKHRSRVFTSGGIIRATILVDGFVAGTWRLNFTKTAARLEIDPFVPLTTETRDDLVTEGLALLSLAAPSGADHDLHFPKHL